MPADGVDDQEIEGVDSLGQLLLGFKKAARIGGIGRANPLVVARGSILNHNASGQRAADDRDVFPDGCAPEFSGVGVVELRRQAAGS